MSQGHTAILSYRLSSRLAWAIRNLGGDTPNKTKTEQQSGRGKRRKTETTDVLCHTDPW